VTVTITQADWVLLQEACLTLWASSGDALGDALDDLVHRIGVQVSKHSAFGLAVAEMEAQMRDKRDASRAETEAYEALFDEYDDSCD
jgi:hypothetical protein